MATVSTIVGEAWTDDEFNERLKKYGKMRSKTVQTESKKFANAETQADGDIEPNMTIYTSNYGNFDTASEIRADDDDEHADDDDENEQSLNQSRQLQYQSAKQKARDLMMRKHIQESQKLAEDEFIFPEQLEPDYMDVSYTMPTAVPSTSITHSTPNVSISPPKQQTKKKKGPNVNLIWSV